MKLLIRSFLFNVFALHFAEILIPGFKIIGGIEFLILAGLFYTILNFFIKPIAKLLFFPINLITLGLFSFVINAGVLYALIYLVKQIQVQVWTFPGFHLYGFSAPRTTINQILTIFLVSIFISVFLNILNWLKK
jgi:putative membrane protein